MGEDDGGQGGGGDVGVWVSLFCLNVEGLISDCRPFSELGPSTLHSTAPSCDFACPSMFDYIVIRVGPQP